MLRALAFILDSPNADPDAEARKVYTDIGERFGFIPATVAQIVTYVAAHLRKLETGADPQATAPAEPEPTADDVPSDLTAAAVDAAPDPAERDEQPQSDPDLEALIAQRMAGENVKLPVGAVPEDHPAAGSLCTCPDPAADPPITDDLCPIAGHGDIPF
jgi:hypothetical protein